MSREPLIAPSILAANFAELGREIERVEAAGADWIHIDVMDGHFVPNITFGPDVVRAIRSRTRLPFDVHLMIAPVDPFLDGFHAAGADRITVHAEAGPHLHRSLQAIRQLGCRAGVALDPATPVHAIAHVLDLVDLVLVMTVNPGFGGQAFIPGMLDKVRDIRSVLGTRDIHVQVDGGIAVGTIGPVAAAGADVFVAGSSIFKNPGEGGMPYRQAIEGLRTAVR